MHFGQITGVKGYGIKTSGGNVTASLMIKFGPEPDGFLSSLGLFV
jgi:hypothetical protein